MPPRWEDGVTEIFFWVMSKGLIPLTASAIVYTRSPGVAYYGACSLACAFAAKGVKRLLKTPRPVIVVQEGQTRKRKTTYGMPSTHASAVAFMATYIVLACTLEVPLPRVFQPEPLYRKGAEYYWREYLFSDLESLRMYGVAVSLGWASMIMGSRVYLGHHTIGQVLAGVGFGAGFAAGCFWVYYEAGLGGMLEQVLSRIPGLVVV